MEGDCVGMEGEIVSTSPRMHMNGEENVNEAGMDMNEEENVNETGMDVNENETGMDVNEEENVNETGMDMNEEENVNEMEAVEGKTEEPKVNMTFDSLQAVHEYYVKYARQTGFVVCTKSSQKSFDDWQVKYVTFACNRFGKSRGTPKNMFRPHPVIKTECKAKLSTSMGSNGKWRITSLVLDHNHELSPGEPQYNRRYKVKRQAKSELNDRDGIRTKVEAEGQDGRNNIEKTRRLRLRDGDATAIQNYFLKMQASNSNFFYVMDLDEDGLLKNLFWADARSRAAYEDFGDVITFDTTYLKKKYDIPFALFLGINHHGQSILLGCGLISSEDTSTFTWLFQSWLACMSGCAPAAIITNQDKAMQNAIEVVFPNARHRWWLWHVLKRLKQKLKGYKEYKQFKSALQNVVCDSLTPPEFEENWHLMIEKFKLNSNEWLIRLYNERHRWVPAFVKDSFWAGISITGRSDSMHAFFDGYVNSKTTLKQFVEQYENALKSKVEKENVEDLHSFNLWVPCITNYEMEKQLQEAYTTAKFREFQDELAGKMYCELSSAKEIGAILEYEVSEDVKVGERLKRVNFNVFLNKVESVEECEVKCSCCLFEFKGILCRHAISVLIHKKIYYIPAKYILQRWRKDLKRRHSRVKISYDDWSAKPEGRRFDKIFDAFNNIADLALEREDKCNMVVDWMLDLEGRLRRNEGICGSSQPIPRSNSDRSSRGDARGISKESRNAHTPLAFRSKGRPQSKRKQFKVDQIVKKVKGKKKKMDSEGKKTNEGKGKKHSQVTGSEKIVSNEDQPIRQIVDVIPTQEILAMTDSQITQNVHVSRSDSHHPSTLQFDDVPLRIGMPHMPVGIPGFQNRPPVFAAHQLYFGQGSQGYFAVDPDSAQENLVFNRTDLHDSYWKSGNN